MYDSLRPPGLQPTRLLCPGGFSRQEYWGGLPCPPPGDLPNPGIEPRSPTLKGDSLPSEPPGYPKNAGVVAYPYSRGTSQPRNLTRVSYIAGRFFTSWTREDGSPQNNKDVVTERWGAAVTNPPKYGDCFGTGKEVETGRVLRCKLEKVYMILKRLLGTWKLEVILVKPQMEKENMFIETRGRAILFVMWQRTRLNCERGLKRNKSWLYLVLGFLASRQWKSKFLLLKPLSLC